MRRMAHLAGTTIVALTGLGSERDRQQAREAGFDGHLTKPAAWADIKIVLYGARSLFIRPSGEGESGVQRGH